MYHRLSIYYYWSCYLTVRNEYDNITSVDKSYKKIFLTVCKSATPAEINKHLELGRDFLARGQLSDALNHYHAAVGKNCLRFYLNNR